MSRYCFPGERGDSIQIIRIFWHDIGYPTVARWGPAAWTMDILNMVFHLFQFITHFKTKWTIRQVRRLWILFSLQPLFHSDPYRHLGLLWYTVLEPGTATSAFWSANHLPTVFNSASCFKLHLFLTVHSASGYNNFYLLLIDYASGHFVFPNPALIFRLLHVYIFNSFTELCFWFAIFICLTVHNASHYKNFLSVHTASSLVKPY